MIKLQFTLSKKVNILKNIEKKNITNTSFIKKYIDKKSNAKNIYAIDEFKKICDFKYFENKYKLT